LTHNRLPGILSDLYKLKIKVENAEEEGRDLLGEMASQVDEEIVLANKRLAVVTRRGRRT